MPLYKTISISPKTKVYIWKVGESEADLSRGITLSPHCSKRFNGMRSEMHRRGFLSIRHLMAEAGYVDSDLFYDQAGKPHLNDGRFISITHSGHFTAIIIGDGTEVGIDIEKQREKILRIAYKFTPIQEYATIANTDGLIRKLTIVWGCKESLYKIYGQQGLSFLHNIDIADFRLSDGKTTGEIIYHGKTTYYDIDFLEFDGYTCVYALGHT